MEAEEAAKMLQPIAIAACMPTNKLRCDWKTVIQTGNENTEDIQTTEKHQKEATSAIKTGKRE